MERYEGKTVLFLTPCFMAYRLHKPNRGVQVFDLELVRRMATLGLRVVVVAERSWRERFGGSLAADGVEIVYTPSARKPLWNGLFAAWMLRGRRFDAMVLGNVSRGLAPVVALMRRMGLFSRVVLIAHQHARDRFLRPLRRVPMDVLAVSEPVGATVRGKVNGDVLVRYGLPNAELFTPRDFDRDEPDRPVRFCMIGRMDTRMKRADLGIGAFERLPADLRARCELHLMGFPKAPTGLPRGVIAHPWMTVEEIAMRLREMDVVVVASEVETFCQALVQGMLCGLGAIARDLEPLIEKVNTGAGIVFSNVDELAAAMERLARSREERLEMGRIGRRIALERYVFDVAWFVGSFLFPGKDRAPMGGGPPAVATMRRTEEGASR